MGAAAESELRRQVCALSEGLSTVGVTSTTLVFLSHLLNTDVDGLLLVEGAAVLLVEPCVLVDRRAELLRLDGSEMLHTRNTAFAVLARHLQSLHVNGLSESRLRRLQLLRGRLVTYILTLGHFADRLRQTLEVFILNLL